MTTVQVTFDPPRDPPETVMLTAIFDEGEAPRWTLALRLASGTDGGALYEARFLAQDAPSHRLVPGAKMSLFRGPHKVADAVVCLSPTTSDFGGAP